MLHKPAIQITIENEPAEIELLKRRINALINKLPADQAHYYLQSMQRALQASSYDSVIHLLGLVENSLRVQIGRK